MISDDIEWEETGAWGHHVIAATAAAVLSVVVHGVGLLWISDVRFNIAVAPTAGMDEDVFSKLRILDVEHEPDVRRKTVGNLKEKGSTRGALDKREVKGRPVDKSVIAPRPVQDMELSSALGEPAGGPGTLEREMWEPRQEIIEIKERLAADEASVMPRRLAPRVERIQDAPDFVTSIDTKNIRLRGDGDGGQGLAPRQTQIGQVKPQDTSGTQVHSLAADGPVSKGKALFEEKRSDITGVKPIEQYLVPCVQVYKPWFDIRYGYFKIDVSRAAPDILPVLPKDIMLVQDCSASITEQRLRFCREGLAGCLDMIGPDDRFNVISFSDKADFCFKKWQNGSKDNIEKAKQFVSGLKSGGNTDIFASMNAALRIKREKGRPAIAFVITDGMANTGMTKSSNIIGEFSKGNNGEISIFTMGTVKSANTYLLDLMAYCNKGSVIELAGGRWGIPDSMQDGMNRISRPVMMNVKFRFPEGSSTEVYPLLASNLYLDDSMVIYGRYPRRAKRMVFQAVGDAGGNICDMLFSIPLDQNTERGGRDIRREWAKQKIYHLIGQYTRNPDIEVLKDIRTTARRYRVDIPYEGKF